MDIKVGDTLIMKRTIPAGEKTVFGAASRHGLQARLPKMRSRNHDSPLQSEKRASNGWSQAARLALCFNALETPPPKAGNRYFAWKSADVFSLE